MLLGIGHLGCDNEEGFLATIRSTLVQHTETATTANGVITRNGKLVAADSVLRSWLGEHELIELLPELGEIKSNQAFQTTLHRVAELPCTANLVLTELDGDLGELMLLRIDIAASVSALYLDAVTGLPDRRGLES